MLFTNISFLYYFLPVLIIIYFIMPKKFKNIILFLASMIFYFYGEPKYILLMILEILIAYIGGILKMLKDDDNLQGKEYPLVLDGPFSKLDPDQRQNVVNMLPTFAPQVIVFSKDDLHDVISKEKNVAKVEEGKLWR